MPKCCKCQAGQSRLNKGSLCKACFKKKKKKINPADNNIDNIYSSDIDSTSNGHPEIFADNTLKNIGTNSSESSKDKEIINLIMENMTREKSWNNEIQTMLKQQIEFLKQEIYVKNTLIENLLTELHKQSPDENLQKVDNTESENISSLSSSSAVISTLPHILDSSSIISNKICEDEQKMAHLSSSGIKTHPNQFKTLINDSDSSFETYYAKSNVISTYPSNKKMLSPKKTVSAKKHRSNVVVNKYPERDSQQFQIKPKLVPGNETYSNIVYQGKKTLLLSDSILGRIQIRKFNKDLLSGSAYKKYFPGAKPSEIAHYCKPLLLKEKFDTVVIHVGTNSLYNENIDDIANEIFNLVKICKDHGVNDVLVSGITFRGNFLAKVRDLNNSIQSKEGMYDFKFIDNTNILRSDICTDNLHLNHSGIAKIAINIANAINTLDS